MSDFRTREPAQAGGAVLMAYHYGPARIFVPVCKHPRDYQITTGPLGWVEVEDCEQAEQIQ